MSHAHLFGGQLFEFGRNQLRLAQFHGVFFFQLFQGFFIVVHGRFHVGVEGLDVGLFHGLDGGLDLRFHQLFDGDVFFDFFLVAFKRHVLLFQRFGKAFVGAFGVLFAFVVYDKAGFDFINAFVHFRVRHRNFGLVGGLVQKLFGNQFFKHFLAQEILGVGLLQKLRRGGLVLFNDPFIIEIIIRSQNRFSVDGGHGRFHDFSLCARRQAQSQHGQQKFIRLVHKLPPYIYFAKRSAPHLFSGFPVRCVCAGRRLLKTACVHASSLLYEIPVRF